MTAETPQAAVIKQTRVFVVASVIVGLGVLIAGGVVWWDRGVYKECLKTWPSDHSKQVVEIYRLTKEDFCEREYTLSDYLSLEERTAQEIRTEGTYKAKSNSSLFGGETEREKYFKSELKARIREFIKPEEIENPFE